MALWKGHGLWILKDLGPPHCYVALGKQFNFCRFCVPVLETESNIYLVLGVRSHIYKVPLAMSGIKEIFRKWQLSLSPPSSSLLGKSPYDNGGNQATTVRVHF